MPEENDSLGSIKKNVEYLRYRLARYQIVGVAPPVTLLIELKVAERILMLESIDTMRVSVKHAKRIDVKI